MTISHLMGHLCSCELLYIMLLYLSVINRNVNSFPVVDIKADSSSRMVLHDLSKGSRIAMASMGSI